MLHRVKIRTAAATLLTLVLLAACGGTSSPTSGPASTASGNASTTTLTFGVTIDPISLDPHQATYATAAWVFNNIYDTLVRLTSSLKLEPSLATSWKTVSPTVWQFQLRKGVRFSDGTHFDAAAAAFTINREMNPKDPGRGVGYAGPIVSAQAVSAHTLRIITKVPDPSLLYALSLKVDFGMVSPTAVKKWGSQYGRHPVGTGPFELQSWVTNQTVTLVQNPYYWGTKPALKKLVFKVIPDPEDRLLAFQNGKIDVLLEPTPSQWLALQKMTGITIAKAPGIGLSYLAYNLHYPPFNDVRVRQALAHAVNIPAIVKSVLHGTATPASSFLNSNVFGYKNENLQTNYAYDPAKAKSLLEQAGWKLVNGVMTKNGQPFSFPLALSPGRVPGDKDAVVAIQQQFAQIGVKANLNQMQWAPFLAFLKTQPTKYGMFFLTWFAVTGDGDMGLTPFDSSQVPPHGVNRMYYDSATFDHWFRAGNAQMNTAQRLADYANAQAQLVKDVPWIPLFQLDQITVLHNYVHGYQITPLEYYVSGVSHVTVSPH